MESETKNSEKLTLALAALRKARVFSSEIEQREEARKFFDAATQMIAKFSKQFGFDSKSKTAGR